MEYESLLNNARWDIIKAISKGKASATELAKATRSSLPNVSQQMKLLEAYDLVEYLKDQRKGQGKPRQIYQLKHDFCHLTFARDGFAEKRFFTPNSYHSLLLNVLFIPNLQDHAYLHKFLLTNEEIIQHCSIGYFKSNDAEIELVLLTDNLELIRGKYSNTFVEVNGKLRKVVAWTHNLHEISEGLSKKEHYFENLMHNLLTIHDPKGQFEKAKRKQT